MPEVKKRGKKIIVFILLLMIITSIAVTSFMYYNSKPAKTSAKGPSGTPLKNPASGLSLEEAVAQFNESFVYYLLVNIKAYNLHNPPLSSETPKINFYIDDKAYNAEIINGNIHVSSGLTQDEDIIIRTTAEEAVKMVMDKQYISESFKNGRSQIELISGKTKLFVKGYLTLYDELSS